MIQTVSLKYFKKFQEQTFDLDDRIVLAGPNNSGKSTLLQAISVWRLVLSHWQKERVGNGSRSDARTGVPISRKAFTSIPLGEMNLLWTNRKTAFSRDEAKGKKPGHPKGIEIRVDGTDRRGKRWSVAAWLRFSSKEQIYAKVIGGDGEPLTEFPFFLEEFRVVHVPPFSGIGAEETRYDAGYRNLLIGQGKPGDILRNLLLKIHQENPEGWTALVDHVRELFGCTLLEPRYGAHDPFIRVEYRESGGNGKPFDLASAGSGFHQVLTLFGFLYAHSASVLLVDEPDAHAHVLLQRQVLDRLREAAREMACQLVISTHSEVLLEDTAPANILSFYGRPHRLGVNFEREQVREALKRLTARDILLAERGRNILYLEDFSDLKILTAFARVLDHPVCERLKNPFFHPMRGSNPREARGHFFGLKAISPEISGVVLLDGDNRNLPDHEVAGENLTLLRWRRYEIENYLLHPAVLERFVRETQSIQRQSDPDAAMAFLKSQIPPDAWENPNGENEFLVSVPASKRLLPEFMKAAGLSIGKNEYFQIVSRMEAGEVHAEVVEKLEALRKVL